MRILVVDDVPGVRRALRRLLRGHGYETVEAGDIAQALAAVERHEVDAVLSDVNLGAESGFDLLRRLRGQAPIPRLVLMTGALEGEVPHDLAGVPLLFKPFTPAQLAEALRDRA